jgi:hypothetical protein
MSKLIHGLEWRDSADPLQIEFQFILSGGHITSQGKQYGLGLLGHFKAAETLCWPEDDHHRWSDLILGTILENRINVIMGSRDSTKTRSVSKWALIDYWCSPNDTLILMTSTDTRGLEMRVFGDIKSLHERAKARFPWIAGNVVDSKHGIFTDDVAAGDNVRDMRRGIIGIPCLSSQGEYMGMALKNFAGIKQKRRRLVGDELQFIPREYLKVLDSLDKGDFKAAVLGNPIADNGKALDEVSEPKEGWASQGEITKTSVWPNKYNGVTVNLVGIDSPNFDAETLNRYNYMVDQGDVDRVSRRPGGKDSLEWWSQIMGVRKAGAVSNKVLTVAEIQEYGGFGDVVWLANDAVNVYSIDAGFGGDPCVRTWLKFGREVNGQNVIEFGDQRVIPILISSKLTAEEQIAHYAKAECLTLGIPFSNVFFDAGMYATLAVWMSRLLSPDVNAVNFGGTATQRPVSNDTFVFDEKIKRRRLKTCYEAYSKFVTELWFSVRLTAQCRQLRKFPREAAEEFGRRQWEYVSNDRYELETKDDYKLRYRGESPNNADSLAIGVEGARRLGFAIEKMDTSEDSDGQTENWLTEKVNKHLALIQSKRVVLNG